MSAERSNKFVKADRTNIAAHENNVQQFKTQLRII